MKVTFTYEVTALVVGSVTLKRANHGAGGEPITFPIDAVRQRELWIGKGVKLTLDDGVES